MFQLSDICHAKTTCSHQCKVLYLKLKAQKLVNCFGKGGWIKGTYVRIYL